MQKVEEGFEVGTFDQDVTGADNIGFQDGKEYIQYTLITTTKVHKSSIVSFRYLLYN